MKTKTIFLSLALALSNTAVVANETIDMTVYRSPTCSCCKRWVSHVEQNGFKVKDIVTDGVQAIKDQNGITPAIASCHTALVGGYAIEGHVPASDIKTLLQNKPKVAGISVPGMPVGTPGMEMGGKKDAYDVISFDKEQKTQVFKSYKAE
jgi:hypothetical protein